MLGQPPPDSPGLLGAEVERQVFLALVEDAELLALSGVDDSQDTGDRLADIVAVTHILVVYVPPCSPFLVEYQSRSLKGGMYILVSLEEAPLVIFWTRRLESSSFSSSSCFCKSVLDFFQRVPVLTPG